MADLGKFRGIFPPMVTPFKENEDLDEKSLRSLTRFVIDNGIHGLTPCGSSGEFYTLSFEERERVVEIVLEENNGRVPVIAGSGYSGTRVTIEIAKKLEKMGVDALMIMPPYYFLPTREGIKEHFRAIGQSVGIPVFIYDNPNATKVDLPPAFIAELFELPNIDCVKLSNGGALSPVEKARQIKALVGDKNVVFSGADMLFYYANALDCIDGAIIGLPQAFPEDYVAMYENIKAGKVDDAHALHRKYLDICALAFTEVGKSTRYPCFFKLLAHWRGVIDCPMVRRPMLPLEDHRVKMLETAFEAAGYKKT